MEKELIEFIAKALVDDPAAVEVSVEETDRATVLSLKVSEKDIGKVIGKQGRIAKSIRTLLQASGSKSGKHTVLEIID